MLGLYAIHERNTLNSELSHSSDSNVTPSQLLACTATVTFDSVQATGSFGSIPISLAMDDSHSFGGSERLPTSGGAMWGPALVSVNAQGKSVGL